jgi:hypothetical protein
MQTSSRLQRLAHDNDVTSLQQDDDHLDETLAMRKQATKQIQEAMEFVKDKEDYEEAVRLVPDIVEAETHACLFMRREDFNAWAAATRLAIYWKTRRETFAERAFRAMFDLSGGGCLNKEDVKDLKTGLVARLPADASGRSIYCIDHARMSGPESVVNEKRIRFLFFWISLAGQNRKAQKNGMVFLRIMDRPVVDRSANNRVLHFMSNGMAVRIEGFHLIYIPPTAKDRRYSDNLVTLLLQILKHALGDRGNLHIGYSGIEVLPQLLPYGLKAEGLPVTLGGSWTYDKLEAWIKYHQMVYQAPGKKPKSNNLPTIKGQAVLRSTGTRTSTNISQSSPFPAVQSNDRMVHRIRTFKFRVQRRKSVKQKIDSVGARYRRGIKLNPTKT